MSSMTVNKNTILFSKRVGLWIGLVSVTMMFVALTSAYIVRRSAGNWMDFRLPNMFFISTVVILLSSIALEMSYRAFLVKKEAVYKTWLVAAFALGIGFCITQVLAWQQLDNIGVTLTGNPSGSFIYAISALHVVHVLGGILALTIALYHAFSLPFFVSPERKNRFKLVLQYWHYVDILWIYLLIFFLVFR